MKHIFAPYNFAGLESEMGVCLPVFAIDGGGFGVSFAEIIIRLGKVPSQDRQIAVT